MLALFSPKAPSEAMQTNYFLFLVANFTFVYQTADFKNVYSFTNDLNFIAILIKS